MIKYPAFVIYLVLLFLNCYETFLFPKDLISNITTYLSNDVTEISEECDVQLKEYEKALKAHEFWALKVFDSSSRLPSGILSGHISDFGSIDQCLSIDQHGEYGRIQGKYCLGVRLFPFNITTELISNNSDANNMETFRITQPKDGINNINIPALLVWAVCSLSTCSAQEIQRFYSENNLNLVLFEPLCQIKSNGADLDGGAIATVAFLVVILCILILSTVYDVYLYFKQKHPAHTLLIAFSAFTNGKKIFKSTSKQNQISCIDGIRSISMMGIIIGHKFIIHVGVPTVNWLDCFMWFRTRFAMVIAGGYFAVDSFLLLSALLLTYVFMNAMEKGTKFNVVMYYVHRYVRLTPALAVIILIHVTLIDRFFGGPFKPGLGYILGQPCKDDWWINFLYVQNYANPTSLMCVGPSWYLAVDTQLYWLTPLILIPLWKKPKFTLVALSILTFCSVIMRIVIMWFYEIRFNLPGMLTPEQSANYDKYFYFPTHMRLTPWLMGVILGFLIYKLRKNEVDIIVKTYNLQVLILSAWGLILAFFSAFIFIFHDIIFGEYDNLTHSILAGILQPCWCLAVSWIIFACTKGYGGPVNLFLSLPIFQFLSMLSYSMFLVHYPILFVTSYRHTSFNYRFSQDLLMYNFWGDFVLVVVAGIILTLTFESPIIAIEKAIFTKRRRTEE